MYAARNTVCAHCEDNFSNDVADEIIFAKAKAKAKA